MTKAAYTRTGLCMFEGCRGMNRRIPGVAGCKYSFL